MKALCLLVSFIVTSNAVDITPWETEADTVWTEAMLRPKPAEDRKGMQEECARRIGLLDLRSNKLIPVTEAVPAAIENSSLTKKGYYGYVFIVANGANEGTWLSWHPGCLGTLARVAATRIASPSRSHRRKLFLYNIAGRPIYDNEDGTGHGMGRSLRLLQLLVEGEAWMWGGVAPGFSFRIGRPATLESTNTAASSIQLRTLALSPRVLQVVNVLNEDTMQGILDSGERLGMRRSPEKHYDNSGRFANYRTSKSSFLTGQHPSHNVVRGTCQVVARLAERSYVEWPQLLRYDPGDWYKTHRDTFHDFKHPNRRRLIDAKNQGSPGPFQLWTKWIRRVLDNEGQMPKPRQESDGGSVTAVTAITWIQEVLDGISLNPPPASDQDIFELELAGMLLKDAEASATLGEKWLPWLKDNHARRSVGLISTLLGEGQYSKTGGRPELLHFVHRCWVEAVKAQVVEFLEEKDLEEPLDPDALVDAAGISWYDARAAGADEESSQNEEDILGPPWVEPNRHCTLMFYLNSPVADGGETTFPLAEGKARVALQSGEIAIEQDVEIEKGSSKNTCTSASNESLVYVPTVIHPGMPECSKGLRVKPFKGGGALFYHKHGDGSNDEKSSHGGCPPLSAEDPAESPVAWKINGFMWNTDSDRGPRYFH